MLYIGVPRRGSLPSAAQREDRPSRTLATGAAALLIAAIVGVLALTGASAQESYPATPEGLNAARLAFIAEVARFDADVYLPESERADGQIVINGMTGPDTLERALEWLNWQVERERAGKATLAALPRVKELKAAYDATKKACEDAYGVCEWATLAPDAQPDVKVRVRAVRVDVTTWRVQVQERGPRDGAKGEGEEATVELTDNTARAVAATAYTLSNGTLVAVVVDLKRDKRVEFFIVRDSNQDGEFTRADSDSIARPDARFAPSNTPHARPLLSSTVDIPYTATAWWLQGDGSRGNGGGFGDYAEAAGGR